MYSFSLFYDFFYPSFRFYCENPLKLFYSYVKFVLAFRRRVLRFLGYLALGGFFLFISLAEVTVVQPTLERASLALNCYILGALVFSLLVLMVLAFALPRRIRGLVLGFLGSQAYVFFYNFFHGDAIYYRNYFLNLAVTKLDAELPAPTGIWHSAHEWICAHPYITAGIAFAVGVTITVAIYAISSHYGGDAAGEAVEVQNHEAFNIKLRQKPPLTPERYVAHKEYITYLPDGTTRPSTYEEVAHGFSRNCRIARIPDKPVFRNDGLKTWQNFEEDLKQFPLNTKMDLRYLVNQCCKSMDQIEKETYIMHKILYCLFDGGENEAMVREFSYWDAKYTPLHHLAIVKTASNEVAIVFRGWLESFTYDDWKFN